MTTSEINFLNSDPGRLAAFLERKRAGEAPVAQLPILPIQHNPTISTLANAESAPSSLIQRPQLSPPNYMREVLSLQTGVEDTLKRQIDVFRVDSARETKSLEALEEEKTRVLLKHAEEVAAKNSWSVLATVSQYIAGSSAIFMGIASGGWAGVALIASGSLGLGNRVIHDTVGWQAVAAWFTRNEALQKSLAHKIEMGSFYLSLGLGLAGGMWAYHAGTLAMTQGASVYAVAADKIGKVVGAATTVSGTVANFGESYASKQAENLRADMKIIEAEITLKNHDASDLCSDAVDALDMAHTVTETLGKLVTAESNRSYDL